jgi:CRISPR-associated protein Cmr2
VLALLPVDKAIDAALALRGLYATAFNNDLQFTLSASIVYTHYKNPLTAVLRQSAHYLDEVAKKENGRNSLALAVAKPGGVAAAWVSVFEDTDGAIRQLNTTAQSGLGTSGDAGLSGGFFHTLRQNYLPLFMDAGNHATEFVGDDILRSILIAEIKKQFGGEFKSQQKAGALADEALLILRPKTGHEKGGGKQQGVAFDGGLIVRFLSTEGRWKLQKSEAPKP